MTKTHRLPSGTIQPSTIFKQFDLPEFISELPSAYARMQAAQSYAWRIDITIVQAVRSLFKHVRDEAMTGGLDDAMDYNLALAEQAFAESCFEQIGSDSLGPVRAIHELLDLRESAHDLAYEATRMVLDWKGNLRSYEAPSISDLFHNQGTIKPKATTLARIARVANRSAARVATGKDVAILADKLASKKIAREQARLTGMAEGMKSQAGALEMMFAIAARNRPARMSKQLSFWEIDLESQRTLIAGTKAALERAEDYATSDSNMAESEFDDVCLCVELANETLSKVLRSPRFNSGVDGNAAPTSKVMAVVPKPEPKAKALPKPKPKPKAPAKRTPKVKPAEVVAAEHQAAGAVSEPVQS